MAYVIDLPVENSNAYLSLPNGGNVYLQIRFRPLWAKWTLKLLDENKKPLTDEVPLIYNSNIFKQYSYLQRKYGVFSVKEKDGNFSVEDIPNKKISLIWNDI